MEIPVLHSGKFAYHFTHIENLDSILKHGLLPTNKKNKKQLIHKNVAAASIQSRRSEMVVSCEPGGTVHDYVPFYFCSVNPMLLSVLNSRNVDQQMIIFLCVNIDILLREGTVFTDASANTAVPPKFYNDPKDLDKLDWVAINSRKWGVASDDERHKRMAELLIYDQVDISDIKNIIVWNPSVEEIVKEIFKDNSMAAPLIHQEPFKGRNFYFTKFQANKSSDSLVTGPYFFKQAFESAVKNVKEVRQQRGQKRHSFPFKTVKNLLNAIEKDFGAISELKNIEGLKVKQGNHYHVASEHTLHIINELKQDVFFKNSNDDIKELLLVSGYLLGIGKAPHISAPDQTHQIFTDFPLDSLEKLTRVLGDEIENLSNDQIRKICLLVGYHDLVSDIILHYRDKDQLLNITKDPIEIEMLISISRSGIPAADIFEKWEFDRKIVNLRHDALASLP